MAELRAKCPACGHVYDTTGNGNCPKCQQPVVFSEDGYIQVYRMGSPLGVAAGFGLYINGEPYGHLANKQSVRIPLPYGSYNLHFTCGMNRKGQDVMLTLSPDCRKGFAKVHMKPGFWSNKLIAEEAKEEDMPTM